MFKEIWPIAVTVVAVAGTVFVALYRLRKLEEEKKAEMAQQAAERREAKESLEKSLERSSSSIDVRMGKFEAALIGITTIAARAEATQKDIEDMSRRFDAFTTEVRSWNVAVLQAKVTSLDEEMLRLRSRVHDLAQDVTELTSIQHSLTELRARVDDLFERMTEFFSHRDPGRAA